MISAISRRGKRASKSLGYVIAWTSRLLWTLVHILSVPDLSSASRVMYFRKVTLLTTVVLVKKELIHPFAVQSTEVEGRAVVKDRYCFGVNEVTDAEDCAAEVAISDILILRWSTSDPDRCGRSNVFVDARADFRR